MRRDKRHQLCRLSVSFDLFLQWAAERRSVPESCHKRHYTSVIGHPGWGWGGERVATLKQYMTVETSGIIAHLFDHYKQFCHDGQNGIMRSIIATNESAWLRRDTHVCIRSLGFMFLIHWRPSSSTAIPCPALPCPTLSYPTLPCPALPCPDLPCPALPCRALPCHALPGAMIPCGLWRLSGQVMGTRNFCLAFCLKTEFFLVFC